MGVGVGDVTSLPHVVLQILPGGAAGQVLHNQPGMGEVLKKNNENDLSILPVVCSRARRIASSATTSPKPVSTASVPISVPPTTASSCTELPDNDAGYYHGLFYEKKTPFVKNMFYRVYYRL